MARPALFKRLSATLASATLLVLARPACAKPVEVTRFSTPQTLAQLGWQQAGRAVAVVPAPDSGIDPQSLVDQPWLDAVAREVATLGFGAATPGAADILAEVDVVHDRLAQGGGRGPVNVGLGGATGGRHSSLGLGLGFNFGPSEDRFVRLAERVEVMARREGEPLVLVGWSLGGLFARQLAKAVPEQVGLVITMGTPFSGDRRANNAWRAYQLVAGHSVDEAPMGEDLAVKPPVPTVALWSPRDGFIAPRCAAGWPGERDLAVALRCTHLGFAAHPQVARTLVDLIAQH